MLYLYHSNIIVLKFKGSVTLDENIIDTDFNEVKEEFDNNNDINGKQLYFLTSQVAQIISETDSTVRFWATKFKSILKIEMSGSHRKFSRDNIEKLKYIKKLLREDHFSINQVMEFAEKDIESTEIKIQESEPMAMQALASAIMIEVGAELEDYKLMIKKELIQEMKQGFLDQQNVQEINKQEFKDFIAATIQNNESKQLSDLKFQLDTMQTQESEAKDRDIEILDLLKLGMEDRVKASEINLSEKKGFFKNIFGKRK